MLQKLNIQNYAIIDELEIEFSNNLNIITGETGAGKSILMGALSLILGNRADSSVLQQKERKCIIEGYFSSQKQKTIQSFLKENELDNDEELVIRREIAVNGKSRAFINDTPVNLNQLKELSSLLVDLHQQFDTLELGDNDFQREVLDALADNVALLTDFKTAFTTYTLCKKQLTTLQEKQAKENATLDYNQFLFDELNEINLQENELENLDAELKLLSNAENIKHQLGGIYFELTESEQPIVQQIKSLSNRLQSLTQYHPNIESLLKRLQATQVELQDVADELENINNTIQYSAERIQLVNDKMAVGYKLLKKHNVTTTTELLAIQTDLQIKLTDVINISDSILKKEKETTEWLTKSNTIAGQISANRKKAIQPFTKNVNALLAQVGMPNAQLKIQVDDVVLNSTGCNNIEFLFDANKSNHFEPLRKVASGGELSRLMLCIKSLVAKKLQLPTLIFDEIDTGISGEAAKQVGNIMKELSASHQLISITHQPQIAAKANAHYFVYKAIKADKIVTSIRLLNNDERITTIAQMLSGEKPTAAALENAREMIGN
ncbi:MAG: DNA repair protein RecN [Chitinophagaceae bacterium]|nr:DNA repair protein RecN [Chitinophagaceae bacterium]